MLDDTRSMDHGLVVLGVKECLHVHTITTLPRVEP